MSPAWHDSPFFKAVRREAAGHVPVWLMRQAGRYLPEYRELRSKVSFLGLCKDPALCAEVMIKTVQRLGVDAAILFSDLLLILEPMGLGLDFPSGEGPVLGNPIRTAADVDRLRELENMDRLQFVVEAVRQTRAGLAAHVPLIGFGGAPFTLAAYAVEGGSSRDYRATKSLMYSDAAAWDVMMGRIARSVALYLNAQIDAGAQAVQLFDSWVGCLGVDDYRRYVLPYSRAVIQAHPPRRAGDPFCHGQSGLGAAVERGGRRRDRRRLAAAAGRRLPHDPSRSGRAGESRSGRALRPRGRKFAAASARCSPRPPRGRAISPISATACCRIRPSITSWP